MSKPTRSESSYERDGLFLCGGLAILTSLAAAAISLSLEHGVPLPQFHDEFSYLLAGDTFASGRLANPSHPMWQHFETFHVLQRPSYVSKYPPGQGLVLALGRAVAGHPIVGVWIALGLMAAAIFWMLDAWIDRAWAVIGTCLAVLQTGLGEYWGLSYWGGAPAALGGALVLGAVRRAWVVPSRSNGVWLGVGAGILALTRPFEGLLLVVIAILPLAHRLLRGPSRELKATIRQCVLPALAVVGATLVWLGYYNYRTTGDPLRMPYQVYEQQYSFTPNFIFLDRSPAVTYRHAAFREYYHTYGLERYESLRTWEGFLELSIDKLGILQSFYLGPGVLLLLLLPWAVRDPWIGYALAIVLLVTAISFLTNASWPHYLAPAAGLVYLLVARCLQIVPEILEWRIIAVFIVSIVLTGYAATFVHRLSQHLDQQNGFAEQRHLIHRQLEASPGRDLIIVEYVEGHNVHEEWVYNRARIDEAEIVWARSMGPKQNDRLINYFDDRRIWKLTVGERPRLRAYDQR